MSLIYKPIDQHIDEMRAAASRLVDHTYPKVPKRIEADIDCLKQRQVLVDGYDVAVHFSCADYNTCHIESVEIVGVYVPFLPMYLVCKIASLFLGSHELKYAESFKRGRKVYMWTVALDSHGRPIRMANDNLETCTYEDFVFSYIETELL